MIAPDRSLPWRKLVSWLGLACIFVGFVIAIIRLHPVNLFGYTEDDSIYFSSAKGLAEGKGYVLESFPETPAATKYPIFYPWLLSWVWRWNPSFPANLTDAIAVNAAFGALYIFVAFLLLRRFKDLGETEVLILTAFCALHPLVVFYSSSLLSEIPFAAMALAAMYVAERAMRSDGAASQAVICGVLVGLCMLTRAFAVPVAAGIVLAAFVRRAWRPLMIFCAAVAPFFALLCWHTVFPNKPISPAAGVAASGLGWTHTWTYYTNYVNVWKEGVPTTTVFFAILKNNALLLLNTPATYFIYPSLRFGAIVHRTVIVSFTVLVFAGVLREAFRRGLRPFHFVFPFYALLILVWNYGLAERFLIPFLPIFAVGIWLEMKHILRMVGTTLGTRRPVSEKVVALGLSLIVLLLFAAVAQNYFGGVRSISAGLSRKRGGLLEEKLESYQWLAHSTSQNSRVVAYEDASLFLYSGRAASRPFTFTTAEFYDPKLLDVDIEHITDVARAIGAEYWLTSEDDYDFEWPDAFTKGHHQTDKVARVLPVAHQSPDGRVRVYSLGCLQHPEASSCEVARRVLFPKPSESKLLGQDLP